MVGLKVRVTWPHHNLMNLKKSNLPKLVNQGILVGIHYVHSVLSYNYKDDNKRFHIIHSNKIF